LRGKLPGLKEDLLALVTGKTPARPGSRWLLVDNAAAVGDYVVQNWRIGLVLRPAGKMHLDNDLKRRIAGSSRNHKEDSFERVNNEEALCQIVGEQISTLDNSRDAEVERQKDIQYAFVGDAYFPGPKIRRTLFVHPKFLFVLL
jgi:hypothetical protein